MENSHLGKIKTNCNSSTGGGNVPRKEQFWKGSKGRWAAQHVIGFGKKSPVPWIHNCKDWAWRGWAMGNNEKLAGNPPSHNNCCRNWLGTWEAEIQAATASSLLLPMSWIKGQLKHPCICHHQTSKFSLDRGLRSWTHLLYQMKAQWWADYMCKCFSGTFLIQQEKKT